MLYNTHSTLVHTEHRHYHPEQISSKPGPNFQFLKLDISVAGGWPGAGPGQLGTEHRQTVNSEPLVHTLSLPVPSQV